MSAHHSVAGRSLWAGAAMAALLCAPLAAALDRYYIAPGGNDAWSGKSPVAEAEGSGPFATLERARDAVRALKASGAMPADGVEVILRGGVHPLSAPVAFGPEDSGTATAPVVYRANPGEKAVVTGGKTLTGFTPVSDPALLERLDPAVRGRVLQCDLKAQGVTEYGSADDGAMALYFQGRPTTAARWPNDGFVKITDIVEKDGHQIHGIPGSKTGKFVYDDERPARWRGEKDPWLHGYWFWDWSDQRQRIAAIDPAAKTITLTEPWHGYGYRKGQWYYAFNMLCELDAPGEWHVDREAGVLYFLPPAPMAEGDAVLSVAEGALRVQDAARLEFRGLTFEAFRGTAITVSGGEAVRVAACTLRNISGGAVTVSGGLRHTVAGCDIYQMARNGISLGGGDRTTLTPAGHCAENNHIYDYGRWSRMYQTAISLDGVGNRAAHNLIHDAPHMAVGFGGNDHLIEFNEIHHVCLESNDAGAMYAGRNWTMRGHVIRNNHLHDISGFEGRGCVGVYLDDMFASAEITGNLFERVTMAAFIGGGRDCAVTNNIFIDCNPALHVDARALGWAHYHADEWIKEAEEKGTLSGIAYDKPPYSERYPALVNILNDEPKAPRGNLIALNICNGGKWDHIEEAAAPHLTLRDNFIDQDAGFENAAAGDYRLKPGSPALAAGFQQLPLEKMGLYPSPDRASPPPEK